MSKKFHLVPDLDDEHWRSTFRRYMWVIAILLSVLVFIVGSMIAIAVGNSLLRQRQEAEAIALRANARATAAALPTATVTPVPTLTTRYEIVLKHVVSYYALTNDDAQVVGKLPAGSTMVVIGRSVNRRWYKLDNGYWVKDFVLTEKPSLPYMSY